MQHSFEPFTTHVRYDKTFEKSPYKEQLGIKGACTPVSVPPTPVRKKDFNESWNKYTTDVLDFVSDRLQRTVDTQLFAESDMAYSESDALSTHSRQVRIDEEELLGLDSSEDEMDTYCEAYTQEDQMMGGFHNKGGPMPVCVRSVVGLCLTPDQAQRERHEAYVRAGERLVDTILHETEAAVDIVGSNYWDFVVNTQDVLVMKRKKPIKQRHLLNGLPKFKRTQNVDELTLNSPIVSPLSSPQVNKKERPEQYCFMGSGIINASAEDIFEMVRVNSWIVCFVLFTVLVYPISILYCLQFRISNKCFVLFTVSYIQ